MPPKDPQALDSTLQRAKAALKSALGEACHADIDHADARDLIRVEEVLESAAEAAKEAASVRLRLEADRNSAAPTGTGTRTTSRPAAREIEDQSGVRWVVHEARPATPAEQRTLRERFREGWLSFGSESETRRVAPIPAGWREMPDRQLLDLLKTGEAAPRRLG